jgi:alpha-1,3-rhamnosyl/mannosyltransferase
VVAYANSALPEVVGDGGILVPDGDVEAFAAAVTDLLIDDALRASMASRGIQRAAAFTWERCAGAHADLFRSVADARS